MSTSNSPQRRGYRLSISLAGILLAAAAASSLADPPAIANLATLSGGTLTNHCQAKRHRNNLRLADYALDFA